MKNNKLITYSRADINYLNNKFDWGGTFDVYNKLPLTSTGAPRITTPSTPLINIPSINYSNRLSPYSTDTMLGNKPVSINPSTSNVTWGNIKGIGKGVSNILKGIGGGSIMGGITSAIGFGLDIANSFAAVDRHLKEETLKVNLIANQNVDTSSNRSIVGSIGNQWTLRDRTKSDMLDLATSLGGLFGNWLAGGKAKRAADLVNMAKINALKVLDKTNDVIINQANEDNALLSQSNITALGGPIDTLDVTNPLSYGIALDWLGILLDKANKDKISLLSNNLNNDTLFKLFTDGGKLNEGDEVDLTEELIKELEKLGYKLEY